jgi:hypothetical protein
MRSTENEACTGTLASSGRKLGAPIRFKPGVYTPGKVELRAMSVISALPESETINPLVGRVHLELVDRNEDDMRIVDLSQVDALGEFEISLPVSEEEFDEWDWLFVIFDGRKVFEIETQFVPRQLSTKQDTTRLNVWPGYFVTEWVSIAKRHEREGSDLRRKRKRHKRTLVTA